MVHFAQVVLSLPVAEFFVVVHLPRHLLCRSLESRALSDGRRRRRRTHEQDYDATDLLRRTLPFPVLTLR